jgi:amidohydrolase
MAGMTTAKDAARSGVEAVRDDLIDLSHRIHAHPELKFEEVQAAGWVADLLARHGFTVETGVCDLPTAFVARVGTGPLHIGICAEYDALPDIGHACGHNVIAAAAAGAGIGLAPLADELGLTITVLGTPAEEGGGGKILMLDGGAFAGIHAAMMVHPGPVEQVSMPCLAIDVFDVHYHGKSAHASAWPEQGINAADALTIAQTAIGMLRQHIRQTDRIHGIVTKGGSAPNIVPAETSAWFCVRSKDLAELAELGPRVQRCFEAGALATGCTMDVVQQSPPYSEMKADTEIGGLYRANAEALGRRFPDIPDEIYRRTAASTDMANVSLAMPTIHPMLGLDSAPAVNHQPEFAAECVTPKADRAALDGAMAMAWTSIDLATTEAVRSRLLAATTR